jgi:DNA modification methylase
MAAAPPDPDLHGHVTEVPVGSLREWPENPRTISEPRFAALKQALVEARSMLWARPLIALPDGTVIAGNMRLRGACDLGWETIPVVYVDLTPDEARVWALRDNNAYGEWDEPRLAEILAELGSRDVDVALAGFADRDLDRILAHLSQPADPDAAPDPPSRPRSRPGCVYELGDHRLLCGDATNPEHVERLLAGERADVLWTDPPYGVDYVGKTKKQLRIRNDGDTAITVIEAALAAIVPSLAEAAPFYVCVPGGPQGTGFRVALEHAGMRLHQTLAWVKNSLVLGRCDHHLQHEEILYGWAPGGHGRPGRGRQAGSRWHGPNNVSSVFFVDRPSRSEVHPTMKPVGLIAAQLSNSSLRGNTVLDPFAGSGSTLIACEQLGRRCLAIELDPAYCDVIRDRYQEYTHGS